MRIDRLSVLSRSLEWWCMAAFGRWSDLFGWFRQRTRSKLSSRSQNCFFIKSSLEISFGCVSSYLWWASSLQDSLLFAQGEILGNSRSVMLLNVLGDTRTTMSVRTRIPTFVGPTWINRGGKHRNHIDPIGTEDCNYWSRNEECLVGAAHQTVPITSLPFVHTARRCFRWWCNTGDRTGECLSLARKFTDISSIEEAKVVTR